MSVLDQNVFELLFRDNDLMAERFPAYVSAISDVLPFEGDGAERIAQACSKNWPLARKLRAIYENGHIKKGAITIANIKAYAKKENISLTDVIKGGKLSFDDAKPTLLAKLLNEDFFSGPFSKKTFEAGSKAPRST